MLIPVSSIPHSTILNSSISPTNSSFNIPTISSSPSFSTASAPQELLPCLVSAIDVTSQDILPTRHPMVTRSITGALKPKVQVLEVLPFLPLSLLSQQLDHELVNRMRHL
ncbi:hypothetical protein M5K25_004733 [Dendrobium thyrsiflorum]|uniref:Uncharacterized protein n=1 Tax=Dendrobium thyrsiflorum TaxID=117978 RepID=A0ABD0VMT0_DENTH